MTALSLLARSLKSDEVIELLEEYDVDVVYAFDRVHENTPDFYWASIKDAGIQLRFNEHQQLDTAFCYLIPRHGSSAIQPESIGVPIFDSFPTAERACQSYGLRYQASCAGGLWLKIFGDGHDTHYEFSNGCLSMVTLMLPRDEG